MKYQIVTNRARKSETLLTGQPIAEFAKRGYQYNGGATGTHLREELRGQPKFVGLCGPMWNGVDADGDGVLRYEDWESYEILSR